MFWDTDQVELEVHLMKPCPMSRHLREEGVNRVVAVNTPCDLDLSVCLERGWVEIGKFMRWWWCGWQHH